jgi:hypothetical protein
VAVVAVVAGRNVRWMFASRCRAVVARTASPNDLGVIDGVGRCKDVRVMAILANVRRLDMCGVLAHRVDAVMAAAAVINDSQMIEDCRAPGNGRMTVVTGIATRYVRGMFARREGAVVATVTGTDHLSMVNGKCGREDVGVMAVLADITGCDMREVLTDCFNAVVAVDTTTGNVQVIEIGRQPRHG